MKLISKHTWRLVAALVALSLPGSLALFVGCGATADKPKDAMMQDSMKSDGMTNDGMMKEGMKPDGMMKDGMMKDGMMKDGATPASSDMKSDKKM